MSDFHNLGGDGERVLFFNRVDCEASKILRRKLLKCGFDLTCVESKGRGEKLPKEILRWEGGIFSVSEACLYYRKY